MQIGRCDRVVDAMRQLRVLVTNRRGQMVAEHVVDEPLVRAGGGQDDGGNGA